MVLAGAVTSDGHARPGSKASFGMEATKFSVPSLGHASASTSRLSGGRQGQPALGRGLLSSSFLPQVNSTLVLWNQSLVPGNYLAPTPVSLSYNGYTYDPIGYDPVHNTLYVGATTQFLYSGAGCPGGVSSGHHIYLFNATTGAGERSICIPFSLPLNSPPSSTVYDPANGRMYLAGFNSLEVLNTTTFNLTYVPYPAGFAGPTWGAVLVGPHQELWVGGDKGLIVVNTTTGNVTQTIPLYALGYIGSDLQYNPANDEVYVTSANPTSGSVPDAYDNVTAIAAANGTPVSLIPGYWSGPGITYVPSTHAVYAFREATGGWVVSAISTANRVVANFSLTGAGASMVFDPSLGYLVVAYSTYVLAVNPTTGSVAWSDNLGSTVGIPPVVGLVSVGNGLSLIGADPSGPLVQLWKFDAANGSVTSLPVGFYPTSVVYVPATNQFFVADSYGANLVTVVNATTNRVITNIQLGTYQPSALAYDARDRTVYVTSETNLLVVGGPVLSAINVTTDAVTTVATESMGPYILDPLAEALDPAHSRLYVTGSGQPTSGIWTFNTTSGALVAVAVDNGSSPRGIAYDPTQQKLFVANWGSDNVTVFNASTDRLIASIPVGMEPSSAFYDPDNGEVYVANFYSENLTVIDAATETVVGSISGFMFSSPTLGGGNGVFGYDPALHRLYVENTLTTLGGGVPASNLTVLNSTTGSVVGWTVTTGSADGIAVDVASGKIAVAGFGTGSLSLLTTPSTPISFDLRSPMTTQGVVQGPSGTQMSFEVGGLSPETPYAVYFDAVKEAAVHVGGVPAKAFTTNASGGFSGTLVVNAVVYANQSLYVDLLEYGNFVTSATVPASGTAEVTLAVVATSGTAPAGTPVLVSGFGYAPNYGYLLCFESTTPITCPNAALSVRTNGTGVLPAGTEILAPHPGSYDLVVSDSLSGAVVATVGFYSTAPVYAVQFSESGLSPGQSWSASLGGVVNSSTSASIGFVEPNGSYAFTVGSVAGYTVNPSAGTIAVSGAAVIEAITFSPAVVATYAVTFTESGLPSGTSWSVTVNGTTGSASAPGSVVFQEPNGFYAFTVKSVPGYIVSPGSGTVIVSGAGLDEGITFSPSVVATYAVTFTESGLPSGTRWSVTAAGTLQTSTATTITFQEPNGTYAFSVGPVSGYTVTPSTGNLRVTGAAAGQTIAFTSSAPTPATGFLGLPGDTGYFLLGGVVALVVVGVVITLVFWKRRKGGGPQPGPPNS